MDVLNHMYCRAAIHRRRLYDFITFREVLNRQPQYSRLQGGAILAFLEAAIGEFGAQVVDAHACGGTYRIAHRRSEPYERAKSIFI